MQRSENLVDSFYFWLLDQCSQRRFAKGQHLPAQRLSEELGVSLTTVRKALLRAIDAGWDEQTESGRPVVSVLPPRRKPHETEFAPGENHVDIALRAIREKVLRGELPSGTSVNAKGLSEELNVSLPAVRQALESMASCGLLHRQPRCGWRVTTLTLAEIKDIFRVRLRLEPLIIRYTIDAISDDLLDELAEENNSMYRPAGEPSRYEVRQADYHFHSALAKAAGRRILASTLDPLLQTLFMNPGVRSARETFSEHEAIINALRQRDLEAGGPGSSTPSDQQRKPVPGFRTTSARFPPPGKRIAIVAGNANSNNAESASAVNHRCWPKNGSPAATAPWTVAP
jgi:DNA-binding GntR family transcriptional regulator